MEPHSPTAQTNEWRSSVTTVNRSTFSMGETLLLSRAFLEGCLDERLSQENPIVLDSRQRDFLELVAGSASFTDPIAVPKKLLEAFLAEKK